jgi:hypothetical protein
MSENQIRFLFEPARDALFSIKVSPGKAASAKNGQKLRAVRRSARFIDADWIPRIVL